MIQTQNYLDPTIRKHKNQEQEVDILDQNKKKFVKVKIQITFVKDQDYQILYSKEGVILRKELIKSNPTNFEILTNMEQIQYLQWQGEYGQNRKKIGEWRANWKGEGLQKVGGYYEDGLKEGLWTEPIQNYWSKAQVFARGEYFHDQRYKRWNYFYQKNIIGGGLYNKHAQKQGKWIELSEYFTDSSQVTHQGEYKNGKKIGRWDIWYKEHENNKQNLIIGGGSFDEKDGDIKQGYWVEISNRFDYLSQVTYKGEYKNGKKVGRWDIWYKTYEEDKPNLKISSGFYDEIGEGIKQGHWVELSDGFNYFKQVTYIGEYKNGKKIGRWDIWYEEQGSDNKEKIGGGQYDEEGDQIKIGNWKELWEELYYESSVILYGEYKHGKKVGKWDIWYRDHKIGGGSYDETGQEIKIGNWVEISDRFNFKSQVTYNGEYLIGKKIGRWDICFREYSSHPFTQMQHNIIQNTYSGGGQYDEGGNGIKLGYWVELSDGFYYDSQVTYNGEYKNGQKVGRWDICFRQYSNHTFSKIGGGQYNEDGDGIKIGNWMELSDGFCKYFQIKYDGEYKNGKKIGKWDILCKKNFEDENSQMMQKYYIKFFNNHQINLKVVVDFMTKMVLKRVIGWKSKKNGYKVGIWVELDTRSKENISETNYDI
ncbi:unnamed protein product [Paramecium primaurelia]|uniref:Uncharacterized protein n=1 Tax=Paramecium primaurelia TaxID=5886 RepID=A0A8S1NHL8_PARPR|nr:unnamed protein product [Paramecium primaurelia]